MTTHRPTEAKRKWREAHSKTGCCSRGGVILPAVHAALDAAVRAAFEERGHIAGCRCLTLSCSQAHAESVYHPRGHPVAVDTRCALPSWLPKEMDSLIGCPCHKVDPCPSEKEPRHE